MSLAILSAFLLIFSLGGLEMVTYTGLIGNKLPLEYIQIVTLFLLGLLSLRLYVPQITFQPMFTLIKTALLPLTLIAAIVLLGLDSQIYPNYSFSQLHLNPFITLELLLLCLGALAFSAPKAFLSRNWPMILLGGFLVNSYYIYIYFPGQFTEMSMSKGNLTDDNFMEWLQVWILGLGAIISAVLALWPRQFWVTRVLLVLGVTLFIFLAGEEISWGERIIDIPESYKQNNYQDEFNLHNRKGLNEVTAILYYVAFLYAVTTWLIRNKWHQFQAFPRKWRSVLDALTFRGASVIFLIPTFIYNPYMDRKLISGVDPVLDMYHKVGLAPDFFGMLNFISVWREAFEVCFYAGLTLHVWLLFVDKQLERTKYSMTAKK